MKTLILKDTCNPMFIEELFTRANTWEQPKCPWKDEWIKKMWHIYTRENITHPEKGMKCYHLWQHG